MGGFFLVGSAADPSVMNTVCFAFRLSAPRLGVTQATP
jgi:hypothetical protein